MTDSTCLTCNAAACYCTNDVELVSTFDKCEWLTNDKLECFEAEIIINISSVWGQCGGSCEAVYSAAKAGLVGLTKALAKEYPNIGVNCICPGVIDTPMNDGFSVEERQALLEQIPAGRFGRPEEVAAAALFLASDGAAYITGQVLAVNGGLYM